MIVSRINREFYSFDCNLCLNGSFDSTSVPASKVRTDG